MNPPFWPWVLIIFAANMMTVSFLMFGYLIAQFFYGAYRAFRA